ITYKADSIEYKREYFASFPKHALIFHFEANKPGAYSGVLKFSDAHGAINTIEGNKLIARGKLQNGLQYETQIVLLATGGIVTPASSGVRVDALKVDKADSFTIMVFAGTNYAPDRSLKWRGPDPHDQITRNISTAIAVADYQALRKEHLLDYRN